VSRDSERRLDLAVEEFVAALTDHVAATVDERRYEDRDTPLTTAQAMATLGIKKTRLYDLLHAGELTGYKEGGRRLFTAKEIRHFRLARTGELGVIRTYPVGGEDPADNEK
jgi:excisionase family DNA binding protein